MAKLTISKDGNDVPQNTQIVYVDRIVDRPIEIEKIVYQQNTVEVPIEIEKIVYVERNVEVIKEVPVERIVYEQKEVLVHVPQPCEIIRIVKEEKILKILPMWAKMLMAAQTVIIVLIMVIK